MPHLTSGVKQGRRFSPALVPVSCGQFKPLLCLQGEMTWPCFSKFVQASSISDCGRTKHADV